MHFLTTSIRRKYGNCLPSLWLRPSFGTYASNVFGIDGLTIVQQRVIAIFVFAILSWLTECIPAWATSLALTAIMCVTVSKNAFGVFKGDNVGKLLDSTEIMASFADPIIMLFLAGFIIAIAASKSGLDTLLARNLIRPFGKRARMSY